MEVRSRRSGMMNRVSHHRRLVRPTVVTAIHLTHCTEITITARLILTQREISQSQQRCPRNRQRGKTANKRIMAKAIKIISGRQQHPGPLTQPSCRINLRPVVRNPWKINQKRARAATAAARASTKSLQPLARRESRPRGCPTPRANWTRLAAQKTTIYCPKWINWNRPTQIFTRKRLARRQSRSKRVRTLS